MKESTIIRVLESISYMEKQGFKQIKKHILERFKNERKEVMGDVQKIKELGLNVYNKKGISYDAIINFLLDNDYVVIDQEDSCFSLSEKGKQYMLDLYTNDFSEEYLKYKNTIDKMTTSRNEPRLPEDLIARHFWNKLSFDSIYDFYFKEDSIDRKALLRHEEFLGKMLLEKNNDFYFLHLMPMIFLDWEDMSKNISMEIIGVEKPEGLKLGKPWPNKRYVVAGWTNIQNKYSGFYTFAATKENFPDNKVIEIRWQIGEHKEVIHRLNLSFKFDTGFLFSTKQSLRRDSNIEYHRICAYSSLGDINELLLNKNTVENCYYNEEEDKEVIYIEEKVTLTSIPIRLHYI